LPKERIKKEFWEEKRIRRSLTKKGGIKRKLTQSPYQAKPTTYA